jgi:hypothetical protein
MNSILQGKSIKAGKEQMIINVRKGVVVLMHPNDKLHGVVVHSVHPAYSVGQYVMVISDGWESLRGTVELSN